MKKVLIVNSGLLLCLLLVLSSKIYGETGKGDMAIVLNWPGIGFKYCLKDNMSVEAKIQSEQDVSIIGVRGYYYFKEKSKIHIFTGAEINTISFKGEEGKGNGTAIEVFIGGERFFERFDNKFSVELDFGPALISLNNTDKSESLSGIEFVVNIGISWYFNK